ncbi:MAG: spore coat protein U domain-containing protein [Burkholderiales bacterium]
MKMSRIWLIACALALPATPQAHAAITCTASNTTINFGSFNVLSGATKAAVGGMRVTCVSVAVPATTVTYNISLATSPAQQMAPPSGPDRVTYQLYLDAGHSQVWGDGTAGTLTITGTLLVPSNGRARSGRINYYGLITPGGQDVSAASPAPPPTTYRQTMVVTVTCSPNC